MRVALARRYFEEGDHAKALGHYRVLLQPGSDLHAEVLRNVGWILFASSDETQAAARFVGGSLRRSPDDPLGLWFLAVIRLDGLDHPTVVDSPLVGQPVPDVILPYLEQYGELSLRARDGQVVVVNFWASWCVPCRSEHDDLVATAAAYADRDVTFVGIIYQDSPRQAIRFLDELGRGYDHLTDPWSRAAIDFGVFGIPETFFTDRDGTVVVKITGESNREVLSRTLDQILAGRRPESRTIGEVENAPGG